MKKLFALLLSCCIITGTLVACGEDEKENLKTKENTSSNEEIATKNSNKDSDDIDDDDDDDDDEATKKEKTTKVDVEDPTEEETDPDEPIEWEYQIDDNLIGFWAPYEDESEFVFFDDINYMGMAIDYAIYYDVAVTNDYIEFDGETYDYEFDGEFLTCYMEEDGEEILFLELEKFEADNSTYEGNYFLNGGYLYDEIAYDNDIEEPFVVISIFDGKFLVQVDMAEYTADGETLIMFNFEYDSYYEDDDFEEYSYSIDGDELTVIDEDGYEEIFYRADFS